jgi:hypothetical protein
MLLNNIISKVKMAFLFFSVVLRIEPRASFMVDNQSTTGLRPQPKNGTVHVYIFYYDF